MILMNAANIYQYPGIIFDMDGVLFDSMPLLFESACQLLVDYGIHLENNKETVKQFAGTNGESFAATIESTYNPTIDWKVFYQRWEKAVLQKIEWVNRIPGVFAFLILLHNRNIKIGLATSSKQALVDKVFCHHQEMRGLFDCIVSSEDVSQSKPHPDIFIATAKKLNLLPKQCIVIEDSLHGLQAAKHAGMTSVAITTSFEQDELIGADHVISSFYEII